MGWLKLFADGSLGSRTAALLEPYEPEPGFSGAGAGDGRGPATPANRGISVTPQDVLANLTRRAAEAGIVGQIHAIGDAALRSALGALEPVAPASGPMARIEHVQFAEPGDLPRFGRGRIAASVQPCHLATDATTARRAWGDRAEVRGFAFRGLLESGAVLATGTDAPVEPVDPWPGIAIAVTRTGDSWPDPRPFGPRQAITLAQAIRAATIGPALVAGEVDRGRLVAGHRADFIAIPAEAIDAAPEPGGPLGRVRPDLVAIDGRSSSSAEPGAVCMECTYQLLPVWGRLVLYTGCTIPAIGIRRWQVPYGRCKNAAATALGSIPDRSYIHRAQTAWVGVQFLCTGANGRGTAAAGQCGRGPGSDPGTPSTRAAAMN